MREASRLGPRTPNRFSVLSDDAEVHTVQHDVEEFALMSSDTESVELPR